VALSLSPFTPFTRLVIHAVMSGRISIFYGAVVNPQTLTSYDAHPRCLLAVGPSGNIEWMEGDVASHDLESTLAKYGCNNEELIELKEGEFLLPGFVDTHTVSYLPFDRPRGAHCTISMPPKYPILERKLPLTAIKPPRC
jgi:hypothetical protein